MLIGLLLGILATTSLPRLAATLFDPAVLWGLLALQAALPEGAALQVDDIAQDTKLLRREAAVAAVSACPQDIVPRALR